jgi:hypothetical protein
MILKRITYFGQPAAVGCDAKCNKAWGINSRPKVQLSDDEDDYEWLADGELGDAPADPGTSEGGDTKPAFPEPLLNKWCVRECERCAMTPPDGSLVTLRDFSERIKNKP